MPLKFNESTKMLYYVYQIPLSLFVHNNWGLGSRLLRTNKAMWGRSGTSCSFVYNW